MKASYTPIQLAGKQPDRKRTTKKDEHDPSKAPIFRAKIKSQTSLRVTPNSKGYNIHDKLPMFNQVIMYPEYAPNM